jgi:hypothetical protein
MLDGVPNPAYDPNYEEKQRYRGQLTPFTPTLRLDFTDDDIMMIEQAGMTMEDSESRMIRFFHDAKITDGLEFSTDSITVIESGQTLKNFQSLVVAVFEIDEVLHLKLGSGDVVAVKFYRV